MAFLTPKWIILTLALFLGTWWGGGLMPSAAQTPKQPQQDIETPEPKNPDLGDAESTDLDPGTSDLGDGQDLLGSDGPSATGSQGLSDQDLIRLKEAGLSTDLIADLAALHAAEGRERPLEMTVDEVIRLKQAGLNEDHIRLLIGLDWMTIDENRMPVTPEETRRLLDAGFTLQALRAKLSSEVAQVVERFRAKRNPPIGWDAIEARAPKDGGPGIEVQVEDTITPDPQADLEGLTLSRQVQTRADGKQVVVYRTPFDDMETELSRKVYLTPEGKQTIVYGTPGGPKARMGTQKVKRPDGKEVVVRTSAGRKKRKPSPEKQQKDQLDKALEILRALNLHLDLDDLRPYR